MNNVLGEVYDETDGLSMTDRFKIYESRLTGLKVSNEYPIIIRLDGHKFTSMTKKFKKDKPFSPKFDSSMKFSAKELMKFSKADMALIGSDEVSLIYIPRLGKDDKFIEAPYGGRVEKMVSLYPSYLSVKFSRSFKTLGIFDARVFNIPEFEVLNYIMSRQISLNTNAVSQYADYYVGKKSTFGINSEEKIKRLNEVGIDFDTVCDPHVRYGTLIFKDGSQLCQRFRRSEMSVELINKIEYTPGR